MLKGDKDSSPEEVVSPSEDDEEMYEYVEVEEEYEEEVVEELEEEAANDVIEEVDSDREIGSPENDNR